jgi:hypothetical protein
LKSKEVIQSIRSDTEKLAVAILDVIGSSRKFGIEVWLSYGALLGMVREERLLPWNNDAEICCLYVPGIRNRFERIAKDLTAKGYQVYYYSLNGSLCVKGDAGVVVNLNVFYQIEDYLARPHEPPSKPAYDSLGARFFYWFAVLATTYSTDWKGGLVRSRNTKEKLKCLIVRLIFCLPRSFRRTVAMLSIRYAQLLSGKFGMTAIPSEYFSEFVVIEFYGETINVPARSEELLHYIYGSEWRTPKDEWSFYDSKNRSETSIRIIEKAWNYDEMDLV